MLKRAQLLILFCLVLGCANDSPQKRFQLAERLWNDQEYGAAVSEFEKVYIRDPKGKLGVQALFRAALTETLYLGKQQEAVKRFKQFIEIATEKTEKWEAQKHIGDIYFLKLENYPEAIQHYKRLLEANPGVSEEPEFKYRIGKSYFYLGRFADALSEYQQLYVKYPSSPWGEKALLETATTLFTQGGIQPTKYKDALEGYRTFIKKYPTSAWLPEAEFGVGTCLEELDQLDDALEAYRKVLGRYPQPKVVEIKIARLEERKNQKGIGREDRK